MIDVIALSCRVCLFLYSRCELNVDGERAPYVAMELRVFRGILNVLCK